MLSRCKEQHVPLAQAYFSIGGVRVSVSGKDGADVSFLPTLEPFRVTGTEFDLGIDVEWASGIASCQASRAFDSGTTWTLYDSGSLFEFHFHSPNRSPHIYERLLIDKQFKSATLQMNREYFADFPIAPQPLGYPLDELLIMHRLTQEKAIELHGTGIVRANGDANLFVGHSGAGKSTTTRLWTDVEDVEVLSDDRIIVRRDDTSKNKMRMYGTPWHGEAMFASPNSAPLSRIFVLEHGHGNVIKRLNSSQAVAELFARSFVPFHRHEYVDSALQFLEELANSVPVYRYAFEPDQRAVEKIRHFHD